jgi:uncharacterized phage protein (TIGR02218 family)
MRSCSSSLKAYLLGKPDCWSADLFTLSLADGTTIYLTSSDQAITANGHLYTNQSMTIERNTWEVKNTTDVPQLEIQMYSSGTDFNGNNFKQLAHQGVLDGGYVQLDRAFMPNYGNLSLGTVTLFGGSVSTVTVSATGVKIIVKGMNVLMQQFMPKNMFQLGCTHTLYDAGCTASRSAHTLTTTAGAGSNNIGVAWSSAPSNFAQYSLGTLKVLSGAGEGQIRTVQSVTNTFIQVAYPFYEVLEAGDSFSITLGCDKTLATCTSVFANEQHYRGFPFIPPPETAYS